jgi:SAM-dependent methyltransferase
VTAIEPTFVPTRCAICDTLDDAELVYASTFSAGALIAPVFSARRLPDRVHFAIVRCRNCGLVRSDPVVDADVLAGLYVGAGFTYAGELSALRMTYGRYLRKLTPRLARRRSLLDIGCGNGFMLEEALSQGYEEVRGVEPTLAAANAASPAIREFIETEPMRDGLFAPDQFDVITLFQTLDHLGDPNAVLAEAARALRGGGILFCLNHDVEALSARVLGARSPIFDLQHMYLYSHSTLGRLVEKQGLIPVARGRVVNDYSLRYLAQLVPLPTAPKRRILAALDGRAGRIRLALPLGNLWLAARKP